MDDDPSLNFPNSSQTNQIKLSSSSRVIRTRTLQPRKTKEAKQVGRSSLSSKNDPDFVPKTQIGILGKSKKPNSLLNEDEEEFTNGKSSKRMRKMKYSVQDLNTSDDDDDEDACQFRSELQKAAISRFKDFPGSYQGASVLDELYVSIFGDEELGNLEKSSTQPEFQRCPNPSVLRAQIGSEKQTSISISDAHDIKTINDTNYETFRMSIQTGQEESIAQILVPTSNDPEKRVVGNLGNVPLHEPHDQPAEISKWKLFEELSASFLKIRKYKDQVKVLRSRFVRLFNEYVNTPQFTTLADLVGASAKFLSEDQLVLYLMQLKGTASTTQGLRYSVKEKVLALALYQQFPQMYKKLRKLLNMPSQSLLEDWLETLAKSNPNLAKSVMYYTYVNHIYNPST